MDNTNDALMVMDREERRRKGRRMWMDSTNDALMVMDREERRRKGRRMWMDGQHK